MRHFAPPALIALAALALFACLAAAQPAKPFPDVRSAEEFATVFDRDADRVVPGLIELQFDEGLGDARELLATRRSGMPDVDGLLGELGLTRLEGLFFSEPADRGFGDYRDRFYVAHVSALTDIRRACLELMALPGIRTAWPVLEQPVHRQPVAIVEPDDPLLSSQYYLATHGGVGTLRAKGAWGHSLCDTSVVVAICDTGVDLEHPDLAGPGPSYLLGNLFIDWAEYNGIPGFDDDGNGKIDDWRGWDFVNVGSGPYPGEDYSVQDNDPDDFEGHGTSCAGCSSAIPDNGTAISSIGWNTRILPLRIGWAVEDGDGNMTAITYSTIQASAFDYARIKGAQVINLSYGSSYTPSLFQAVNSAWNAGVIMVVSAGNDGVDSPDYLATTNKCVDVAATGPADLKTSFSNFGSWIDVSAPGEGILTTAVGGGTTNTQGTSFSAPIAAGLIAQIYWHYYQGVTSQANAQAVIDILENSCDDIDALNPLYAGQLGAGRINAFQALGGGGFFSYPDNFSDLQEAIEFALPGDTIAMKGSATGSGDFIGPDKDLVILGAYDEDYESRDPVNNRSLMTGNGVNTIMIFVEDDLTPACVIDGFRLEGGGGAQGSYPEQGRYGGNLLVRAGLPSLRNITFAGGDLSDESESSGGGAFINGSDLTLESCRFESNLALRGGGLGVYDATVTLNDCSFVDNSATHNTQPDLYGGAVHIVDADLIASDCDFSGNAADDHAGAIFVPVGRSMDLTGCDFSENSAGGSAGAIYIEGSATLNRCSFTDNQSVANGGAIFNAGSLEISGSRFSANGEPTMPTYGGAIYASTGSVVDIRGTLFDADQVQIQGSALYATGASGSFVNNTVNGIQSAIPGCAVTCFNSGLDIRNCQVTNILGGPPIFASGAPMPTAAYNNFHGNGGEGDYMGFTSVEGDRHDDPLYADAAGGDFHLLFESPSLDVGDPAIFDFDGGRSDIGAYGGPAADVARPASPSNLEVVPIYTDREFYVGLVWTENTEDDLAGYALYRDTEADFEPSPEKRIALLPVHAADHVDPVPDQVTTYYYKLSAFDADDYGSGYSNEASGTGQPVAADESLPTEFALHGAWPNPFNPTTQIAFALPVDARVKLRVFDARGREVLRSDLGGMSAGRHTWTWNGRGDHGRVLSSGVYTLRIEAGDWHDNAKLTLLK